MLTIETRLKTVKSAYLFQFINSYVLLLRLQKRSIIRHEGRSVLEIYPVCQVSLFLLFLPSPGKRRIIFFLIPLLTIIHNYLMILIFTFDEGIYILNALHLFLAPLKNIYCDAISLAQFFSLFMNQIFQRALTV